MPRAARVLRRAAAAAALCLGLAAMAAAHTGVQNPAVLARMQNMTAMSDQMEIVVPMARGTVPFDAARAAAALATLARLAAEVPELFRAPETDPASEALPAIWTGFADFTARAGRLQGRAADAAAAALPDADALRGALRGIGRSCGGCHDLYRATD